MEIEKTKQEEQQTEQQEVQQPETKNSKSNKRTIVIGLILVVVIGVLGYFAIQIKQLTEFLQAEGVYFGITIGGEDVSGYSEAELLEFLQENYQISQEETLTLVYGDVSEEDATEEDVSEEDATEEPVQKTKWEIPFSELHAGYDMEGAAKMAYELGRVGTTKEKYAVAAQLMKEGINIEVEFTYDHTRLDEILAEVAKEFNREVVDSEVIRENGKLIVTQEQEGLLMEQGQTVLAVQKLMQTHKGGEVQIAARVTKPKVTAEENKKVTSLIGTFYTTYNNSDPNRNNNLVVGCKNIDGTILAPGEVFSANEGLGSQTAEGGYKMAAIYNNGKVEQGMAGGVCQVTTTLYNAAILAEMEIVERHPHSMTVGYVPLGRDAAVAGTYKDLKIKNNTEYPILIEAYAKNGKLVVNLFGYEIHPEGRAVAFDTVYEATIPKPADHIIEDPNRPEGEREVTSKGRSGSKVSVYKTVTEDGNEERVWFSASSYRAVADEVVVGTKKKEETAPVMVPQEPTSEVSATPQQTNVAGEIPTDTEMTDLNTANETQQRTGTGTTEIFGME